MITIKAFLITVEPQFNKGPEDWQNMFTMIGFCCIEIIFYIFHYCWIEGGLSPVASFSTPVANLSSILSTTGNFTCSIKSKSGVTAINDSPVRNICCYTRDCIVYRGLLNQDSTLLLHVPLHLIQTDLRSE